MTEFNLGSSKNSYLFFKEKQFRDDVFIVIRKAFGDKHQLAYIDMKHQQIKEQIVFEKGASQTVVSGNDNIVGSHGNVVAFNGDAVSGSSVVKDSKVEHSNIEVKTNDIDFPWKDLSQQFQDILNSLSLTAEESRVFQQLLEASETENKNRFTDTVQKNSSFFESPIMSGIISGTLSNIISTLLIR